MIIRISLMILCALCFKANALVVISDIDDTIRKTDTLSPIALKKVLHSDVPAFQGVRSFFWDIYHSRSGARFYYVTNSFKEIYSADAWLKLSHFPYGEVYQRDHGAVEDKSVKKNIEENYKIKTITSIIQENQLSEEEIWFFGDNSFDDLKVYEEIVKKLKIEKYQIFYHDVIGEKFYVGPYEPRKFSKDVFFYLSDIELLNWLKFPFNHQFVSNRTLLAMKREVRNKESLASSVSFLLMLRLKSLYCGNYVDMNCSRKAENDVQGIIGKYYRSTN